MIRKIVIAAVAFAAVTLSAGCAAEAVATPTPVVTSSATVAAPTPVVLTAASQDDAFMADIDQHGIQYSSRDAMIAVGHDVSRLHQEGYGAYSIYKILMGAGTSFTSSETAFIVAAALVDYNND